MWGWECEFYLHIVNTLHLRKGVTVSNYSLQSIKIQNLRGYYNASLSLTSQDIVIVGPNNAGKTSVLRLLKWALSDLSLEVLKGNIRPEPEEFDFLLPARDARHRARRITLYIKVGDGRSWDKFECNDEGLARLRLNIRLTGRVIYAALGPPQRGENPESDSDAIELLRRLRKELEFVHIPSFRDARTRRFRDTLEESLRSRIEGRALNTTPGGVPSEHRRVADALEELEDVLLGLAGPLWDEVQDQLPSGMAEDADVSLECDQQDLLRLLEDRLNVQVTTGEHDASTVPITELGSGLQSLLDLAFQATDLSDERPTMMATEEPEAFLHPSAQRIVSGRLIGGSKLDRSIVTTHSPIVVEEANYGDVVLCRNHKFYEPREIEEERREEINTALLSGYGAEMLFAESVLLVEGEGDRQFFERLRRRLAQIDDSGGVDLCFVIPVGGNTQFAPWIRLLRSYGVSGDRPIRFLVAADADSSQPVREAFNAADVVVKQEVLDYLREMRAAHSADDIEDWRNCTLELNDAAVEHDFPLHFLSLDLEEAMLGDASEEYVSRVSVKCGWDAELSKVELLRRLGAKGINGGNGEKAPWIRGFVGETVPAQELPDETIGCLRRWLEGAMPEEEAVGLIDGWEEKFASDEA